jgi:hypothetical protein
VHKVIENREHPMYLIGQAAPYVGFDKDGLYLGAVRIDTNGSYYTSIPVKLDDLKKLILFASVAKEMLILRNHYKNVDWSKLYILQQDNNNNPDIILAEEPRSALENGRFIEGIVLYVNDVAAPIGSVRKFGRDHLKEWIPQKELDPMI